MFCKDIIIKILEYDGRIKYRNGEFINQIIIDDTYKKLIKLINIKYFYQQKIKSFLGNHFYIQIVLLKKPIKFGIILDYYYYGRVFMISFYKDISNTFWYKFTNVFYNYFRIYHPNYFIHNYEYL
jgi:hypothetical protein